MSATAPDGIKVSQRDIELAAQAIRRVAEIDKTIEWIVRDLEDTAGHWGSGVRDAFGRNRLSQMTNEQLGQMTFCAVINALLALRSELIEEWGELVEFSDPPCKVQNMPLEHAE